MIRSIGSATLGIALLWTMAASGNPGFAVLTAQQGVTVTSGTPGGNSAVPDPQPRYRNGSTAQARPVLPAQTDTLPRPTADSSLSSAIDRLSYYLPNLLAGLVVLVIGVLVAYVVRSIAWRLVPRTGLDRFLERHGLVSRQVLPTRAMSTDVLDEQHEASRRWHPEEGPGSIAPDSVRNAGEHLPHAENSNMPEGARRSEDVFEQRLSGSPLVNREPVFEQKTDEFVEEQYSFDAPDAEEHVNVSADARRFLEQEEHRPGHPPFSTTHELEEPPVRRPPQLRRSTDLYRPGIGTRAVANGAFWIVVIAALMEACQAAHLYSFADGLHDVLSYIPHLIAAIVIFIISIVVAAWVRERVVGAGSGATSLVGGAVRAGILTIGGFMALRELQIAPDIVKIAFTLAFGAIALASALAFGLGSRKVAEQVTSEIYDQNSSKVKEFGRRLGDDRAA